jgi:hypothetical protein
MAEPSELPVGRVGRVLNGPHEGFWIEIDDDTKRPRGTGGFYILWWRSPSEGYDDWVGSWDDVVAFLSDTRVDWLDEAQSQQIPGRHRHDEL